MRFIDRYVLQDELARGGMATVHIGQMIGTGGFSRTVAIKRLHAHLAELADARAMFLDEARISARISHRNVVSIIDIVEHEKELFLVMDYVHGVPLSVLANRASEKGETLPIGVTVSVILDVLDGLQAAHDATTEQGVPLGIVHRDISPQNVMVGADGMARVVDFGIAKAAMRNQTTRDGQIKGKLRYMAPEQFLDEEVDARTDVYAASVLLWELLTGTPLFASSSDGAIVAKVLEGVIVPPSRLRAGLLPDWDAVVLRGLARSRADRFGSTREMASRIREVHVPAQAHEVSALVNRLAGDLIQERAHRVAAMGSPKEKGGDARTGELTLLPSELATQTLSAKFPEGIVPAKQRVRVRRMIGGILVTCMAVAGVSFAARRANKSDTASPLRTASSLSSGSAEITPPNGFVSADASTGMLGSIPPRTDNTLSASSIGTASSHTKTEPLPRPARPRSDLRPAKSAEAPSKAPPISTRPGCSPMFMIDANGIRRIKPECL